MSLKILFLGYLQPYYVEILRFLVLITYIKECVFV